MTSTHALTAQGGSTTDDVVVITTPAAAQYVGVIRMTAAGLTSRLGVTLDTVEDLKLAVDEAASLALDRAVANSVLTVTFKVSTSSLQVAVEVPGTKAPDQESYAWGVLNALTEDAECGWEQGQIRVSFTIRLDPNS